MPRKYAINQLVPANEISFVFGSPGAGKSTFLCHIMQCIVEGRPFEFAGKSYSLESVKVGYVAFDRSKYAIESLLEKYDLTRRIKWKSYRNVSTPDASDQRKISEIPGDFPDCPVLVVDGLGLTIPGGKTNDYCSVGNYVRYCGTVAEHFKRTMFGVLHAPKPRIGEGISNPRMGALGSTAFPGIAEAMIQIEHENVTDPKDPNRIIRIMPHDGPALEARWTFNEKGLLEPSPEVDFVDEHEELAKFIDALPSSFATAEAVDIGEKLGFSKRTVERHLRTFLDLSRIVSPGRGRYQKQVVC